jgi:decaprenyl-phosphate phosphoribosyltransferase
MTLPDVIQLPDTHAPPPPDVGSGPRMRFPLLQLARPRQWIKNGFVFAPLVFTGQFLKAEPVGQVALAFVLFCAASSATYVFNDLGDREKDRLHPRKRFTRPIAAGLVSVRQAYGLMAVLLALVAAGALLRPTVGAVLLGYLAMNVAYTLRLKHVAVVDLFCIASGFVLRVLAGAVALRVPLSSWMLITTLCLALYLAAVKRRQELTSSGSAGRLVLATYTLSLLDRYAEMSAVGAIVFYSLFTITVRPELSITVPFVLFGLFRYWYIVECRGGGEAPTDVLWKDLPLAATVLLWVATCMYALWPG